MSFTENEIKQLLQDADSQKHDMLIRCQHGDREAFDQFVRTYQDDIYTHVFQMLNDESEALEITREIFVEAYTTFPAYSGEPAVDVWLFRITEAQIQHALQKRKEQTEITCEEVSDLLVPYLDGELSTIDTQRVEQHLEHCAHCRQEYEDLQATDTLLHLAGRKQAPSDLLNLINQALDTKILTAQMTPIMSSPEPSPKKTSLFEFMASHLHAISSTQIVAVAASVFILLSGVIFYLEYQRIQMVEEFQRQLRDASQRGELTGELPAILVIATGPLKPEERSLDDSRFIASLSPEPKKTSYLYIPGSIEQVVAQLAERIPPLYWNTRNEESSQKAEFHIRQISLTLPQNTTASFAQFLQQFREQPNETEEIPEITTNSIKIYIVEKLSQP